MKSCRSPPNKDRGVNKCSQCATIIIVRLLWYNSLMNPQNAQPNPNEQKAQSSAAALGLATSLSQQLMKAHTPQQQQNNSQGGTEQEDPNKKVEELESQFKDFQKEVKGMIKDEIGGLKKDIQDLLKEESDEKE